MNRRYRYLEPHRKVVWKGIVAGVVGGLVASWAMNQFQAAVSKASEPARPFEPQGDDATVKVAAAISTSVADHQLTKSEKEVAGPLVHYTFGSVMAALYGASAEVAPSMTAAFGLPFGAAVWLAADEIGVPLAGLSKAPTEVPLSNHASALAAHLVYGMTADAVRRVVRAMM